MLSTLWGAEHQSNLTKATLTGFSQYLIDTTYKKHKDPYIHVLISGAAPPWAFDEHTVVGDCPDSYDRLKFGLTLKER